MKLEKILSQKRSVIVGRWRDLLLETYSADSRRFLKKQKDRFANPVGTTLAREIDNLYDGLLQEVDRSRLTPIIDRIIRIRAIQDFTPSQAISFIFVVKKIIREELKKELREEGTARELSRVESRVDEMALIAFDIFITCREKIYEMRVKESRNMVSGLLRKADLAVDLPEVRKDLKGKELT
ncbi:MAG: RsbRD N-terminal domain-containing protein [Deltaproteobacteria bacterium]|nr:RsbRD N-terminal domain-containing protein [Deltaproteobacteria bacterium]MBW2136651.1 RsbRD N-terminal domain-containing protein [Deltaproteobacteria bacterium]